MKLPISIIILAYNEEANLEKCLKSVSEWASEIIVVDSYSTDKTLEIAEKFGCVIASHPFKNQAEQFNWALDNLKIKSEWIFRLDADEEITPELWKELENIIPNVNEETAGFYIKRKMYFMGRWIRHGGYYPAWFLRLWRNGKARSEEVEVDEHIVLLEGKSEKLKNDFIDRNLNGLDFWTSKQNNFSGKQVKVILNEEKERLKVESNLFGSQAERKRWIKKNIFLKMPIFFRSFAYFIYRYIFRLGFLDGKEGLIFHFLSAMWYRFLVDAKLYEYRKGKSDN